MSDRESYTIYSPYGTWLVFDSAAHIIPELDELESVGVDEENNQNE